MSEDRHSDTDARPSQAMSHPDAGLCGLETILPRGVAVVSMTSETPGDPLFPEEAAIIAAAVPVRRREFAVARSCARRALAKLGLPPVPILQGTSREPLWPEGIIGSITHSHGFCAAAVARRREMVTLGIDAEANEALPPDVLQLIAQEEERAVLTTHSGTGVAWDRLLFSAKESIFKAWFPVAGTWLGFEDATVSFDMQNQQFSVRLRVAPAPVIGGRSLTRLDGRFLVHEGLILTAVALPVRAL